MRDATISPLLAFFHTAPLPCPYLAGRIERRLVADLSSRRGRESHDLLALAGFRRSQSIVYRPACPGCAACVPIRVRVRDFAWTRTFRRIVRANRDLDRRVVEPVATREQYEVFTRYQAGRHGDGEMALMDFADYRDMVERSPIETGLVEHRAPDGRLVAVILVDWQADGLSAVYSFFDPEPAGRSLGTYMVLDLVRHCAAEGLPYAYLGFWIRNCRKMAYKIRFRPAEGLTEGGWRELPDDGAARRDGGRPAS